MKQGGNFSAKVKLGFWIIFALFLGAFFTSFVFGYTPYKKILEFTNGSGGDANTATLLQSDDAGVASSYFYFNKNIADKPKVSAISYLVGDLDTGEIIVSKNPEEQLPIASVSKLMTALIATDSGISAEDIAEVSKKAVATYGGNGDLRAGEKIPTGELLYPLLLESSNDAAEVLAEHFGRENFIKKMNEFAETLQMSKTSFADPSGLSAGNKSSVSDLFKLAKYLNERKKDLVPLTTKRSFADQKHSWSSNNQFLKKDGYLGGKSGYTDKALQTVVSLFSVPLSETGSRNIAIALLGSNDRLRDVENILKYLNKNLYYGREIDANSAWVKQKEGEIETKEPDFVTMMFTGDIMLDRGVKNSVMKNFDGDYSALFENLDILKKSDIAFANLEGTASDQGEDIGNLYAFRMDSTVVPTLRGAGIGILSVANNHIGDWGRPAYIDTLARLKENEIHYTGGGVNEAEAKEPTIIEKNGMKIGFLGFSDQGPAYMQAGVDTAGILLANDSRFDEIISNATRKVDYLIVSFHFGDEYQLKHSERQEYLAHRAIDNGAKIVVGHHPHVIEDTEVYGDGFIAYSLGNLIFDQAFSEHTMQGMLLEIKLSKEGDMTVKKNIVKLNKVFQPEKVILGKEEKIKF